MKAIAYHEYGPPDVLDLEDVDNPIAEEGEVLVRVYGTAVCTAVASLSKSRSVNAPVGDDGAARAANREPCWCAVPRRF